MKFIKLDPPGSWCFNSALFEMLKKVDGKKFLDVGCGAGDVSSKLLGSGYVGVGIDFSPVAIRQASSKLHGYIDKGNYELVLADIFDKDAVDSHVGNNFDLAISLLVMEHVEDDILFLKQLKSRLKPGGSVIISVPGRKDKWSLEDKTVGHLRRYDRNELFKILKKAGLTNIEVWSIAVPVGNWLFSLSDFIVKMSSEKEKLNFSLKEQTQTSGVREIPFKTIFPPFFKLFLNNITLHPFFILQRFFYSTGLGLTMLARAECPTEMEVGLDKEYDKNYG